MAPTLLQQTGAKYARFEAVGRYIPERVVTNHELVDRIDSSDEWIQQRSGIVTRHFAAKDESAVDMAQKAAEKALGRAGLTGADIDAVVVGCVTHPYQCPSVATLLAHRIGATPAVAFDVSAACAGFCHGVGVASDMVRSGSATRVLVVGVEKLSDFIDFDDRGSAFIFGDGAGAVIVTGDNDSSGLGPTLWGSDGEHWDLIIQEPTWVEAREATENGTELPNWPAIHMQGRQVFRWAVWQMAPVARKALDAAGLTVDDLDIFVPHQANARITESMVKELGLPDTVKVAGSVAEFGNTSAASVPIALDKMIEDGDAKSGDVGLMIGFGSGLAYAAQAFIVP